MKPLGNRHEVLWRYHGLAFHPSTCHFATEKMFEELKELDGSITRDDYFSAAEGWDLSGLKSDLQIAKQAA